MFKIAQWYNNYQAPSVLMIDDLSDAYINVYNEYYKNDWGYLCNGLGSSFNFLTKRLLERYSDIKITFFVPYLRHNVINENTYYSYKKYALGEREEYAEFLKYLVTEAHEIAHHGSNHGKYIDEKKVSTRNNWIHEWVLFNSIDEGLKITLDGIEKFKNICNISISGGKYCGYSTNKLSNEIIDRCDFLYWCEKSNIYTKEHGECYFGKNKIISFPTNFSGNAFNRLSYMTGDKHKDIKKKITKYLQPLYNIYSYIKLYRLYKNKNIISIQEHYSPSTSSGTVQSANIITDIKSLNKIYKFLSYLSIWYATCKDISKYIYVRDNSKIKMERNILEINFNNFKDIEKNIISITHKDLFKIETENTFIEAQKNNGLYVVNLPLNEGKNLFKIVE